MKLIQKTSRAYLLLSGLAFLISTIMLYLVLTNVINSWLDEKLLYSKKEVIGNLKYNYPITSIQYEEIGKIKDLKYHKNKLIFKDTAVYRSSTKKHDVFRQLTAYETIRDGYFKIITRNSLVNNQDFVSIIILYSVVIFLLLLTGLWILNTLIAKNIWNPFYTNLSILKDFSIENQNPIQLIPSEIKEFEELNNSIKNLTTRVQSDYNNLKEFTENASHEMQTPLAIMHSKIELLLQSNNLTKNQTLELHSIYQAGNRLSKLNKALLLLAKVENKQYDIKEKINLKINIEKRIDIYKDFIENKNIKITKNLQSHSISLNPTLINALISNLLSNAIKYNVQNGTIDIIYNTKQLIFSNTGNPIKQDPNNLFNRFKKENANKDSIGLGLAIVKKICDVNNWHINYEYNNKIHKITISF